MNHPHIAAHHCERQGCQNALFEQLTCPDEPDLPRPEAMDHSPGSAVYTQGQTGHHLHTVCKGLVRLEHRLPDGQVRIGHLVQSGSAFGLELLVQPA